MRTLTKESRINSREQQFNYLIEKGYKVETYKELNFFTIEEGKYFTLKVYRGTAANHIEYINYRTEERRAEVIQNYKNNYERHLNWKEEQKVINKGKKSSHAGASAAVKAELKSIYPHIKFSVTSDSFAGGNSVHISWEDGPTSDQVRLISDKYQYGRFNGMEDIYENTNDRNDIPQTKYVSASRSMSKEIEPILKETGEVFFNADKYDSCRGIDNFIYQIFYQSEIPQGATVTGIVRNDTQSGLNVPSTFYTIGYKLPEKTEQDKAEEIPTEKGKVHIVEYGKGIAVIGETKPIKDILKSLGGAFNKYLKCGAGWVFSKSKLEEVAQAIRETKTTQKEEVKETEQEETQQIFETEILPTPEENKFQLESLKIIWHEGKQNQNFTETTFFCWDDVQKAFTQLWEMNERGNGGGYTKVKIELTLKDKEPIVFRVDITDAISNGDFNPSQEHITTFFKSIEDEEEREEPTKQQENIKQIIQTPNTGKLISLFPTS